MNTVNIFLKEIDDVKSFVSIMMDCSFNAELRSGKYIVDAKSIMGIFSLNLSNPVTLVVNSDNVDELMTKINRFIVK